MLTSTQRSRRSPDRSRHAQSPSPSPRVVSREGCSVPEHTTEQTTDRVSSTLAARGRRPHRRPAAASPARPRRGPAPRRGEPTLRRGLTAEQISDLPASIDLVTAARALGVGRTKAYELARTGRFPCAVWKVGRSYRVRTSDLQTFLGLTTAPTPPQPQPQPGSRRKEG
ncbi:helix-turn-helix domain-containing protein [Actinomadura harenae]|uniref:DNA-binding protein n=2 Tax=Actinomadura harenae TaxID=2483351 RepID=A0A3M2LYD0_9ACTN|nr:helix-turn-helix domain-containing protein [Actinomadura harenae]RMI42222.1 DNA-binding protein [Actinomadura harenae]